MSVAHSRPAATSGGPPVFFLGPAGTFSHVLALKRFGTSCELVAARDFERVIEGTLSRPGARGLLPVENSSGGTIYDSIDLLIRNREAIAVIEEISLDVRIALLRKEGCKPDEPVRTVYSHFTQARHHAAWIHSRFPQARLVAVASTATAARKAAACRSAAALASPGAAALYGLVVIGRPPGKRCPNVTHFYVVSGAPLSAAPAVPCRTALVAALPNTCGSLHGFLAPFARQKVSLSRIVSRPVPGMPQTYIFFLEIEGGAQTPSVAGAIARAGRLAESLVSLGSFPVGRRFQS